MSNRGSALSNPWQAVSSPTRRGSLRGSHAGTDAGACLPGFWNPYYVAGLVTGRDKRIGACADTGHWARSGLKPVECLRILKGRISSSHLKDLNKTGGDAHDVPYGTGVCDIKACLDELKKQGFDGNISIEYEYNWDNSVPEVTQCIDFVRNCGGK